MKIRNRLSFDRRGFAFSRWAKGLDWKRRHSLVWTVGSSGVRRHQTSSRLLFANIVTNHRPNLAASGNGGITLLWYVGRARAAVPEPGR